MSEFTLTAEAFLDGHDETFPGARLAEVRDLAVVSIAVPLGGGKALNAALKKAWGLALPAPGATARSGDVLLMGMSPDLAFALLPRDSGLAADSVAEKLGDTAYLTEQTDAWAMLRIEGEKALAALERICPLDLHPSVFAEGQAARTLMEHLGVIVMKEKADRFLLMSASSSAHSFLHAVQTSIRNVT